jgi:hypothetical protein
MTTDEAPSRVRAATVSVAPPKQITVGFQGWNIPSGFESTTTLGARSVGIRLGFLNSQLVRLTTIITAHFAPNTLELYLRARRPDWRLQPPNATSVASMRRCNRALSGRSDVKSVDPSAFREKPAVGEREPALVSGARPAGYPSFARRIHTRVQRIGKAGAWSLGDVAA